MRKLIVIVLLVLVGAGVYWGLRKEARLNQQLGSSKAPVSLKADAPRQNAGKRPESLAINPKARPDDAAQLQKDWAECQKKRPILEEAFRNAK